MVYKKPATSTRSNSLRKEVTSAKTEENDEEAHPGTRSLLGAAAKLLLVFKRSTIFWAGQRC